MLDFKSNNAIAVQGVIVAFIVLFLKYIAYRVTGSIALYSDALESIINVATAVAALTAVYWSAKPADTNHPYGHTKAEYFSAVLEGVLIVIAAISIFHAAYNGFLQPRGFAQPVEGLLANGAATLVNAAWCFILLREGRKRRSPALVADGKHLLSDIVSSTGVLAGLVLAVWTGWAILDPLLAALVALAILWSGWSLVRTSMSSLMDEAVAPETLERMRQVIAVNAEGAIEAHDIRTRHAGPVTFIDFHLVVPGSMSVSDAHAICDRIERALKEMAADAQITIHVEPEEKAKHRGVVVL